MKGISIALPAAGTIGWLAVVGTSVGTMTGAGVCLGVVTTGSAAVVVVGKAVVVVVLAVVD